MAAQRRFALILPLLATITTSALWFAARAQYLRFVCPPAGICQENGWGLAWTDYTPPAVQAAGMLNVPVAFFAQPLYGLVHDGVSKWELCAFLAAVTLLWSYIGWLVDRRSAGPQLGRGWRIVTSVVGCGFAILILLQTITIFHVGILYKIIAVIWSLLMFRHFLLLPGDSHEPVEREQASGRLPRFSVRCIAAVWSAFLVLGGLALSPQDSSGAPNPMLAHVFAAVGALLVLATASATVMHLVNGWKMRHTPAIGRPKAFLLGLDTSLAVIALAAVTYATARG